MKRSVIIMVTAVISFFMLTGCGRNRKVVTEEQLTTEQAIDAAHNSLNSLDYVGTYEGVLPCADCEGIRIEISLDYDTYNIKAEYLGKGDTSIHESSGEYAWNEDGNVIMLLNDKDYSFFVGENTLIKLDLEGNRITGALADKYILRKK